MSDREVRVSFKFDASEYIANARVAVAAIRMFNAENAYAAAKHDLGMATLRAVVPDDTERQDYLDITMGNPATASRIASHGVSVDTAREMRAEGVPAWWIPDLVEYGPERAAQIAAVLMDCIPHGFIPDHRSINRMMAPTDARRPQ